MSPEALEWSPAPREGGMTEVHGEGGAVNKEDGLEAIDDRWRRVEALYHDLRALEPDQRAAALAHACPGDSQLAAEVQSLLDQPDSAGGFLARPAVEAASRLVSGRGNLLTGQRIGAFEINDLLGVGGMGEVYRARDTKLGRDVAIKVLPEAFAHDESRLARFNREARALASLNHPNIAAIYGIEEFAAVGRPGSTSLALVMELVNGEELSAVQARGAMPEPEALPIARQIAKALEGAHEQGIVHRDLKPANIKIRSDGTVKVLDFGLAKVQPVLSADAGPPNVDTQPGTIAVMGTPGYMSPEQIRGQSVDWRSDLFAFGVVLYELLSGRRAFARNSGAETLSATLTETLPDLNTIAPDTDPALAAAVARCLEKKPENRFQSAKDLGLALESAALGPGPGLRLRLPSQKWRVAAVAALFAGLGLFGARRVLVDPPRSPATYRQVTSDGLSITGDISPDGETIAYVSGTGQVRSLMVRDLSGGPPVELYRGEGLVAARWSHSGRYIALMAGRETLVLPRFGGQPARIGSGSSQMSWSPDDSELMLGGTASNRFQLASIQTREVRRVEWNAPSLRTYATDLSPDGQRVLLLALDPTRGGVWSVKKDGTDLRQHVRETRRALYARWTEDGASFYYLLQGANVAEIRRARVLPHGLDPSPEVVQGSLTVDDSSSATFSISRNGRLLYPRISFDRNIWRADIGSRTSSDDPIRLRAVTTGARNQEPRFSPDGAHIVFSRHDGELGQLVMASVEGEIEKVLVSRKARVEEPAWSPDGESVVYILEDDEMGRVLRVVKLRSGEDRDFGPVAGPATPEWAPGIRPLFRGPDMSTYALDSATGERAPLSEPQRPTFHLFHRYSNRGDRIATLYSTRTPKREVGLAVVSLHDRSVRVIPGTTTTSVKPIGWSADDTVIYAIGSGRLFAVRSDGNGIRTMGAFQTGQTYGHAIEKDGTVKLVLSLENDRSDLWVVDNFDAGRR